MHVEQLLYFILFWMQNKNILISWSLNPSWISSAIDQWTKIVKLGLRSLKIVRKYWTSINKQSAKVYQVWVEHVTHTSFHLFLRMVGFMSWMGSRSVRLIMDHAQNNNFWLKVQTKFRNSWQEIHKISTSRWSYFVQL